MSLLAISLGSLPRVWSGASRPMPPQQKMSNVFDKMDTGNSGSITKDDLTQAFQSMVVPRAFQQMGPDALFSKLDPNNNGAVTKQDFVGTMTSMMQQFRAANEQSAQQAETLYNTPNNAVSVAEGNNTGIGTLIDQYL